MSKQKTLKGSFSLCGKGLHTGLHLTVTFNPAAENTGYKIQRIDIEGEPIIEAVAERVVDTQRGTVVGKGDICVSTIEHGLSALYALGIDNCLIQVNGPVQAGKCHQQAAVAFLRKAVSCSASTP